MTRISVVIPLYNKERYIRRAIDSVLSQTVKDFELVVVNDGSTDGSSEVVRGISDKRIRFINQENAGVAAARNTGIKNSSCDLIAFLDADDAWEPQFMETILDLRRRFPRAGAYATARKVKRKCGREKHLRFAGIPDAPWSGIIPDYFRSVCLGPPPVCSSSVAIHRAIFDSVGFFPEGERIGGDQDMWLRIAVKYEIAFSNYVGAIYYMDADNRVCNQYKNLYGYALLESANKAIEEGVVSDEHIYYLREFANRRLIRLAENCVLAGMPRFARKHLKACRTRRFLLRKVWWYFWSYMPFGDSIRSCITIVIRKTKQVLRNFKNLIRVFTKRSIGGKIPS